jgi:hypothetical protein
MWIDLVLAGSLGRGGASRAGRPAGQGREPAGFLVFADGSAAITGMHWASGAEQYAEDDRKRRKEAEVRNTAER